MFKKVNIGSKNDLFHQSWENSYHPLAKPEGQEMEDDNEINKLVKNSLNLVAVICSIFLCNAKVSWKVRQYLTAIFALWQ